MAADPRTQGVLDSAWTSIEGGNCTLKAGGAGADASARGWRAAEWGARGWAGRGGRWGRGPGYGGTFVFAHGSSL